MSFIIRTGLSQIFGFAFAGLARPANPRGAFAPTLLPDFHPEQVCQDKGNYDSLLTPAVQLFRTGGPDLTIRVANLSRFCLRLLWRNPVIPIPALDWGPAQRSRAAVELPITFTYHCESPTIQMGSAIF